MKAISLCLLLLFVVPAAQAGDIKWEGQYRFEALKVFNPSLSDGGTNKAYILHHLTLKPRFQAYDGLTIHGRFDLMNNSQHPNDQLGQTFGSGLNNNPTTPTSPTGTSPGNGTNAGNSNTTGDQLASDLLAVNELYANWVHEFGVLTVGRAPIQFGLGISFNAGYGAFDHWLENRDLIAYRLVMGNFSVMPVLAKSYEGLLDQHDDVNDYILQLGYENPESELQVGFIYQARRSTSNPNSNDTPTAPLGATATQGDNYEVDSYNVFVSQWVEAVKVAFEVGFMSGGTGVFNGATEIQHDGFGGVVEMDWNPEGSRWGFELDLGYASGDDPATPDTYEGFAFDRNYDVAFLLFNHPVGVADFLGNAYSNNLTTGVGAATRAPAGQSFDTAAINNTLFASLGVHYRWAQKYDLHTRLTYATLNEEFAANSNMDSAAGFELDLGLTYEPFKGFQWINRAGLFAPGAAFEGGTSQFPVNNAFGFETKAAITF